MKRGHRQPTRTEWRLITSRRPVVRRISEPKATPCATTAAEAQHEKL